MGYVPPIPTQRKIKLSLPLMVLAGTAGAAAVWAMLFVLNMVTLGGIPYSVFAKFWQDPIARNAYFGGNNPVLHQRLSEIGIEADIKAYYRPRISDDADLDNHVHQILYNRVGYVGEAYRVSNSGKLEPKEAGSL